MEIKNANTYFVFFYDRYYNKNYPNKLLILKGKEELIKYFYLN